MALTCQEDRAIGLCWRATRAPDGVLPGITGWLLAALILLSHAIPVENQSGKLITQLSI